jgi:hypothetical protein
LREGMNKHRVYTINNRGGNDTGVSERLRQMSVSCIFNAVALFCVSRPDSLPQEVTDHAF